MNKKDNLIIGILEEDLKVIKKLLKSQEKQIKDIQKNGFDSDIHPGWHLDIQTGLSYTQGYCVGYIKMAEQIIELLNLSSAKDVESLIKDNKKIEAENKKSLNEIFGDLKKRLKATEPNEGSEKKILNYSFDKFKVQNKHKIHSNKKGKKNINNLKKKK